MSDTPTPETDAIVQAERMNPGVTKSWQTLSDFARKLERERDHFKLEHEAGMANWALRERDALRAELDRSRAIFASACEPFDCKPTELATKVRCLHAELEAVNDRLELLASDNLVKAQIIGRWSSDYEALAVKLEAVKKERGGNSENQGRAFTDA